MEDVISGKTCQSAVDDDMYDSHPEVLIAALDSTKHGSKTETSLYVLDGFNAAMPYTST